jgi:hypothetical protein
MESVEPMLTEESDVVRRKALAFIVVKSSHDENEGVLARYLAQPRYYYDVVCWLDRILYAPDQLRQTYCAKLERELTLSRGDAVSSV